MLRKLIVLSLTAALLATCKVVSANTVGILPFQTQETPAALVDLSDLQPIPTPVNQEVRPLRVAIAAVISPQSSADSYAPMLDYIAKKLGRPVEAVQRHTYAEVNELVRTGEVDMAFVCTSSYLIGRQDFGMQLLVSPQVRGENVYHARIIVPSASTAKTFSDLRGKVFAFTDPLSFSGRIYPLYLLQQIGETSETFFRRTFFTYSHDDAIYAVANGVADGASVDSLILQFALKRDLALQEQIRIIHTSPPFGMPPVVVSPNTRPQLYAQLREILLDMDQDPEGLAALQTLDYDRFLPAEDADYQSAMAVESAIQPVVEETP
ncbi:MAG: phosphate/phosphite/phosphonate ABC transporter substrate-binding protein [Chloroflexi bacterium]|nr:phosphate/phosphite/phosphonate ABC transporter substrate-binding protein [Chloroflexota bacterium]